jgi:hypothetical protein
MKNKKGPHMYNEMGAFGNLLRIDLHNIIYLVFRLFPVFLVMFFVFSSIFTMDLKGFIYLCGLCFSVLFAILTTNTIEKLFTKSEWWVVDGLTEENKKRRSRCEIISLNLQKIAPAGTEPPLETPTALDDRVSRILPLSQIIYSYTFVYLVYIIGTYDLWIQNVLTIILLGSALVADVYWNYYNYCNRAAGIFLSFAIGSSVGALWAFLIDKTGAVKLQYFSGLSNRTICTRPSAQTYICKNGR